MRVFLARFDKRIEYEIMDGTINSHYAMFSMISQFHFIYKIT